MVDRLKAMEATYDPNRLLDRLLQRMELEDDEALCRVLDVGPPLLAMVRSRQLPVGPSLLIRITEVSGISIPELRKLMGDRRAQYRLTDLQAKRRRPAMDDEAGLPNCVQWVA